MRPGGCGEGGGNGPGGGGGARPAGGGGGQGVRAGRSLGGNTRGLGLKGGCGECSVCVEAGVWEGEGVVVAAGRGGFVTAVTALTQTARAASSILLRPLLHPSVLAIAVLPSGSDTTRSVKVAVPEL